MVGGEALCSTGAVPLPKHYFAAAPPAELESSAQMFFCSRTSISLSSTVTRFLCFVAIARGNVRGGLLDLASHSIHGTPGLHCAFQAAGSRPRGRARTAGRHPLASRTVPRSASPLRLLLKSSPLNRPEVVKKPIPIFVHIYQCVDALICQHTRKNLVFAITRFAGDRENSSVRKLGNSGIGPPCPPPPPPPSPPIPVRLPVAAPITYGGCAFRCASLVPS